MYTIRWDIYDIRCYCTFPCANRPDTVTIYDKKPLLQNSSKPWPAAVEMRLPPTNIYHLTLTFIIHQFWH